MSLSGRLYRCHSSSERNRGQHNESRAGLFAPGQLRNFVLGTETAKDSHTSGNKSLIPKIRSLSLQLDFERRNRSYCVFDTPKPILPLVFGGFCGSSLALLRLFSLQQLPEIVATCHRGVDRNLSSHLDALDRCSIPVGLFFCLPGHRETLRAEVAGWVERLVGWNGNRGIAALCMWISDRFQNDTGTHFNSRNYARKDYIYFRSRTGDCR